MHAQLSMYAGTSLTVCVCVCVCVWVRGVCVWVHGVCVCVCMYALLRATVDMTFWSVWYSFIFLWRITHHMKKEYSLTCLPCLLRRRLKTSLLEQTSLLLLQKEKNLNSVFFSFLSDTKAHGIVLTCGPLAKMLVSVDDYRTKFHPSDASFHILLIFSMISDLCRILISILQWGTGKFIAHYPDNIL